MRKKIQRLLHGKAILIPLLALCAFAVVAGTITIAGSGSGTNSTATLQALSAQKQLVLDAIAKNDRKAADESFKKLTEFDKNDALAEAVYTIATTYQYKNWNALKANEIHKYVIDNFPTNSKYALLSGVELIRSQLRSGKNADSDVEKWMNTYKNQTQFASELPNAIYLIAQAYSNNKKDSQANPLFEYVASTYKKSLYGTLAQMRIDAINKNFDAADVVADFLIAHSRDNEDVEKAIRSLAEYYRTNKEYDRSIHFYTSIIDNYENTDDPIKPYTEMIYNYIDMKDTQGARNQIEAMQQSLAGNTKLARANFDIANYFLNTSDSTSALKLHKYNVENYTSILESLWSQAAIVWYYVRAGDEENAYIEYDKMLVIYKEEKTLAKEVAQVGDRYLEVGNSEKARSLYNQVLTDWPQSEYVFNAKVGLIKTDIKDGEDTEALAGIDILIADYNGRSELPNTVFLFGEEYWNLAHKELQNANAELGVPKSVPNEMMKNRLLQARNIWGKIIQHFPNSNVAPEAYRFVANCYRDETDCQTAIDYYQKAIDNYPEYVHADYCQFMIGYLYRFLSLQGILPSSETNLKVEKAYRLVTEKYPDTAYAKTAVSWLTRREREDILRQNAIKYFEEETEFNKTHEEIIKQGGQK